jgi:hypothetical protein
MRQVLIVALCVIAVMAQQPMQKNCSAVPMPSATANYYMPPSTCIEKDAAIKACIDADAACTKIATDCSGINTCFGLRIRCLIGTTPSDKECVAWETGLENAGLYLMAGGSYKDSTLERACEFGLCAAAKAAFPTLKTANGDICPVAFPEVCGQPNFDPPTRSPTQAEYAITFGGAAWTEILKNATKGSPAYKALENAVSKGLAKLLEVLEHHITITDMSVGSLVVKFIVNDPNVNVAAVAAKLEEVSKNPALAATTFSELAAESGVAIAVTAVGVENPATPAPLPTNATTPEPTPASAGLVSVVAAVVAVVAMMF